MQHESLLVNVFGQGNRTDQSDLNKSVMDMVDSYWFSVDFKTQPIVNLLSDKMPPPGPLFYDLALKLGEDSAPVKVKPKKIKGVVSSKSASLPSYGPVNYYLVHRAIYGPNFEAKMPLKRGQDPQPIIALSGALMQKSLVPGVESGPRPSRVMVIGKWPTADEVSRAAPFSNKYGRLLHKYLNKAGLSPDEWMQWYATYVCKFANPDPSVNDPRAPWIKNFDVVLGQEIRLVCPDYILCLGPHAAKAVLGKNKKVATGKGIYYDHEIPGFTLINSKSESIDIPPKSVKVFVAQNPAACLADPTAIVAFEEAIQYFADLVNGKVCDKEVGVRHYVINHVDELKRVVDNRIKWRQEQPNTGPTDKFHDRVSIDCEWHGNHPSNSDAFLRTIQFAFESDYKTAYTIVLRRQYGVLNAQPSIKAMLDEFARLFKNQDNFEVWVGGHAVNNDLLQLLANGVDLRPNFEIPEDYLMTKWWGGFDTMYAAHAVRSDDRVGLEVVSSKYSDCPRWDVEFETGKKAYLQSRKIKAKSMSGYGELPDDLLVPHYTGYDAEAPIRIWKTLNGDGEADGLLDAGPVGPSSRRAYHVSLIKLSGELEMMMTGLVFDEERFESVRLSFEIARFKLFEKIKKVFQCPKLDKRHLKKSDSMAVILYGDKFRSKAVPKEKSKAVVNVPDGMITYEFQPIQTTGAVKKSWADVVKSGKERYYSPSTALSVMESLVHDESKFLDRFNPEDIELGTPEQISPLTLIMDWKAVNKACEDKLQPPLIDGQGMFVIGPSGTRMYGGGLASHVNGDGMISTSFLPAETFRVRSIAPNLQNLASARTAKIYKRALGKYDHQIKSCLMALPGHVLVSPDYGKAELYGLGVLSGEDKLCDAIENGVDLHCVMAVKAFNLDIEPTERAFAESDKKHLRELAKILNFMIPYGGGWRAFQLKCWNQGNRISDAEAQFLHSGWFEQHPRAAMYLANANRRAEDPCWVSGVGGLIRRSTPGMDESAVRKIGREFQNFPVQSLVSWCLSRAISNFMKYRKSVLQDPNFFKMCLQVHDQLIFHVPYKNVDRFVNEIIPKCMVNDARIIPWNLDGTIRETDREYYLNVDTKVSLRWGEPISKDYCKEIGIPDNLGI